MNDQLTTTTSPEKDSAESPKNALAEIRQAIETMQQTPSTQVEDVNAMGALGPASPYLNKS